MIYAIMLCCGLDIFVSPWPQLPPARFDHAYRGHLEARYGSEQQLQQWCGMNVRACARPRGKGGCIIFLPSSGHPQIVAALRRHEIAHCNGWPADHPR